VILAVERQIFTPRSTVGSLLVDGVFFCYTLEPPKEGSPSLLIPTGTFEAVLAVSPKFTELYGYPFRVPLLANVPGRTEIEMHIGNGPPDTLGCTLLGLTKAADWVGESENAFFRLFHRLPETFSVVYSE
jgi:hypothetical protein